MLHWDGKLRSLIAVQGSSLASASCSKLQVSTYLSLPGRCSRMLMIIIHTQLHQNSQEASRSTIMTLHCNILTKHTPWIHPSVHMSVRISQDRTTTSSYSDTLIQSKLILRLPSQLRSGVSTDLNQCRLRHFQTCFLILLCLQSRVYVLLLIILSLGFLLVAVFTTDG